MDVMERLRTRLTDGDIVPDEGIMADCIEMAKNAILGRRFPYQDWPTREVTTEVDGEEVTTEETYVEDRYLDLQVRIAVDLYNKLGAEGEVIHIENGIHRDYEAGWISNNLLEEITPYCGVIS